MARQRKPPSTSPPSDPTRVLPTSNTASASASASIPTVDAATSSSADARIKHRVPHSRRSGRLAKPKEEAEGMHSEDIPMAERPVVDGGSDDVVPLLSHGGAARSKWIIFALASGACAAFNGVFAKLATGELTSSISRGVAHFLHLSAAEAFIEVVVRCLFFGLNLAFNGIMWTLFTTALARGNSTTQVSIMNTSSNFVITAVLGFAIFSESLPPLWWLGAAMLVAGNVIIGQKDEGSKADGGAEGSVEGAVDFRDADDGSLSEASAAEDGFGAYRDGVLVDQLLAAQLEKDDEDDALDLGGI